MDKDDLKTNKADWAVSVAKSVGGVVPFAGPLVNELIGNLIPNQRIDRLEKYILELDKRLSQIDENLTKKSFENKECIDLIEEGFAHASRATSDERREYIASIIANGLDEDKIAYSESKYLLKLLQDLNDIDIIWLRAFHLPNQEFVKTHQSILNPDRADFDSKDRIKEKDALRNSYIKHIERLGLIKTKPKVERTSRELRAKLGPVFNEFIGKQIFEYPEITILGRMLLKQIDLLPDKGS
jgi:hypothetical protein